MPYLRRFPWSPEGHKLVAESCAMNSIADEFIFGLPQLVSSFKLETKLTGKSSKRFRLQFNGVDNVEAKVDGKPLPRATDFGGNCTIVVTASAASEQRHRSRRASHSRTKNLAAGHPRLRIRGLDRLLR